MSVENELLEAINSVIRVTNDLTLRIEKLEKKKKRKPRAGKSFVGSEEDTFIVSKFKIENGGAFNFDRCKHLMSLAFKHNGTYKTTFDKLKKEFGADGSTSVRARINFFVSNGYVAISNILKYRIVIFSSEFTEISKEFMKKFRSSE